MRRGRLIVIDGIDGSGKATQTELLVRRLCRGGRRVRRIEFPQYEKNFFGKLIGEYLRGSFGDFTKTDPRIASVLYAADRYETKATLERWLKGGFSVVADRYVSANQIHQGGKLDNARERKEFLNWLDTLEHRVFGIPRPDLIIYLDIPVSVSLRLLSGSKRELLKKKKKYLRGREDIVEGNRRYLERARRSAIRLAREEKNWVIIPCVSKGALFSQKEIHEKVWSSVTRFLT